MTARRTVPALTFLVGLAALLLLLRPVGPPPGCTPLPAPPDLPGATPGTYDYHPGPEGSTGVWFRQRSSDGSWYAYGYAATEDSTVCQEPNP